MTLLPSPYNPDACVKLVCAMIEYAVTDYQNLAQSGWLESPFKLRDKALMRATRRESKRCAMHDNDSARDLLWFLSGEWLDRVLALAGLDLDADRVRAELVNFYHKHN